MFRKIATVSLQNIAHCADVSSGISASADLPAYLPFDCVWLLCVAVIRALDMRSSTGGRFESRPCRRAFELRPGQVDHIDVPLSPSGIIWCRLKTGDAVRLRLAVHWPCVTDSSGIAMHLRAQGSGKGDEHPLTLQIQSFYP